jgi:hypothetical protein
MMYAVEIGLRYLRSKKRATTSVTTVVAIIGVALGVAAPSRCLHHQRLPGRVPSEGSRQRARARPQVRLD